MEDAVRSIAGSVFVKDCTSSLYTAELLKRANAFARPVGHRRMPLSLPRAGFFAGPLHDRAREDRRCAVERTDDVGHLVLRAVGKRACRRR